MTSPLNPEALVYGLANAGEPKISSDGTRIVCTLATTDRESKRVSSQLWLCNVDGSNARQLTQSGERNRGACWSPDGRAVAFISDRVKKNGIFVLSLSESGEAREVTRHSQDVGELAWSPDGRWMAYTLPFDPDNPDESEPPAGAVPKVRVTRRIDYKQDGLGYLGDVRRQVFVIDVASGERRQLTKDTVDHSHPQWSPDGRRLSVQLPNRNGMCSQLGLIDVETGETRAIGPETGIVSLWSWSPRGDRIIFAGDTASTAQTDFFVFEMASGEVRRLTDDLQCLPDGGLPLTQPPAQPVWLDDHRVLFHAFRAGTSGLYTINADTGKVEQINSSQALNAGLSVDASCRYVVQIHANLGAVGEIVVFDRESANSRVITKNNAALLQESQPALWERFDVRRGNFTVEVWLLKPPDFDPVKKYPLILDVHGGPHSYYGYGFTPLQQCLATNGFLVAYSNPRGSGSYGRSFAAQVRNDWGGEDYLDLMAVVDEVVKRPYVDPGRVGIYGYSYGGYMTAWTIGHTSRFKAAVCGAPCFDLESMYGTSDISHFFGEIQWGGQPHEMREAYAAHSPSTFAHQAQTPTLIVQGEADERCPKGQSEQMFVALKKAGCEVELARYPGGYHGFIRTGPPEHRADFLTRVLAWFKDHLA